jgi:hypothetical protein
MTRLYLANYDGSSQTIFLEDLAAKEEVLLIHAAEEHGAPARVSLADSIDERDTIEGGTHAKGRTSRPH